MFAGTKYHSTMSSDSAVVDLSGMDDVNPALVNDFQEFEYVESPSQAQHQLQTQPQKDKIDVSGVQVADGSGIFGNPRQAMSETMTNLMWAAGKKQATKAWSIYGNIDLLRPYFDVEPSDVIKRLINSFVPKPPTSSNPTKLVTELYGPSMLVLTLIALLLFEMKSSGHTVKEGTLIGTAFGTCFGYWIGCGTLAWLVAYVCNTHATYLQVISMIGYSLTSHCVVVLLSTVAHTSHDHVFFYVMWGIFGGLSTLRMMSILVSRTHGPSQKLIICGVVAFLNLAFLLYLHFAFHEVVEELDDLIKDNIVKEKLAVKPPNERIVGMAATVQNVGH